MSLELSITFTKSDKSTASSDSETFTKYSSNTEKKQTPWCRTKEVRKLDVKENTEFKRILMQDLTWFFLKVSPNTHSCSCDVCHNTHHFTIDKDKSRVTLHNFFECEFCTAIAIYSFSIGNERYNICLDCRKTKISSSS